MRIFAATLSAVNSRTGQVPISMYMWQVADDDERVVREQAMQECHSRFPVSEGFVSHQTIVSEVPRVWIEEAAKLPYVEKITVDADVWDVNIGNID